MPCKFTTNMCSFNAWQLLMTKNLTIGHTKITMLITNPTEDDKQGHRSFMLKCKSELITKIKCCHAFSAWLDEACQKFGIHSQYYHQWKSSWTLCLTMPHPTWGKYIQAAMCLICVIYNGSENVNRVEFFMPNQIIWSLWLCTGSWRKKDWSTGWSLIHLSVLLQRQHQMHSISCRV